MQKIRASLLFLSLVASPASLSASAAPEPPTSSPAPASALTAERARELVLAAAEAIDGMYVDAAKGKQIAQELRRRSGAGRYNDSRTVSALAERLSADLAEIAHDRHLAARYEPGGAGAHGTMVRREASGGPPPEGGDRPRVRVVRGSGPADPARLERQRRSNFGFRAVERLDGNVGYLDLREWASLEAAKDTAAGAMAFLANTDAVILDVRNCPGGAADTVSFLASYFFGPERRELFSRYDRVADETRVEYTTQDLPGRRMPNTDLWILVGPGTASAGESLAYLLQQFGRATVVGEGTAGAGYNVAMLPLGDGLLLGVSVARPIHPKTGKGWEGEGIKPDVAVPAGDALATAHASALRKLLASGSGPLSAERRREIEWAIERVSPGASRKPSVSELSAFSGRYGERTVSFEGGRLVCRASNGRARWLDPVGKDVFTWDEQTRASFARDSAGKPAELVLERADGTVQRFPRRMDSGKEAR